MCYVYACVCAVCCVSDDVVVDDEDDAIWHPLFQAHIQ